MLWFQMEEYYCWDGPAVGPPTPSEKVTSHATTRSIGVTHTGSLLGWKFDKYLTPVQFHCFVSDSHFSGGINACSGNYEYDQAQFDYCPIRIGCVSNDYPWVQQEEYLSGAYWETGG